jgi:hypothetical protein
MILFRPTVTTTTEQFEAMNIDKRQCNLQNEGFQFGPGLKYSAVNCMRNDSIEKSILKSGC